MNPNTTSIPVWLGALGIFLFATIWFLLPLIPALVEWQRGTDAQPLRVVREYDGNVRFFAQGFLTFLNKEWKDAFGTVREARTDREGNFTDGSRFLITPGTGTLALNQSEASRRTVDKVIACGGNLNLPDELYFSREILVLKALIGGDGNVYRAIRGEGAISLGRDSVVLRWLHAQGPVDAGQKSELYGRASSEQSIHLPAECTFQRLHAPVLEFGSSTAPTPVHTPATALRRIEKLAGEHDPIAGRHLASDDLHIEAQSLYQGNVVTMQKMAVGSGTRIEGSLKSRREMRIESGCFIDGAVVSEGDLFIGADCHIRGPIISEGKVVISAGTQIGLPEFPTTVSAPEIEIAPGVRAYGTVWAREAGCVLATA